MGDAAAFRVAFPAASAGEFPASGRAADRPTDSPTARGGTAAPAEDPGVAEADGGDVAEADPAEIAEGDAEGVAEGDPRVAEEDATDGTAGPRVVWDAGPGRPALVDNADRADDSDFADASDFAVDFAPGDEPDRAIASAPGVAPGTPVDVPLGAELGVPDDWAPGDEPAAPVEAALGAELGVTADKVAAGDAPDVSLKPRPEGELGEPGAPRDPLSVAELDVAREFAPDAELGEPVELLLEEEPRVSVDSGPAGRPEAPL